MKCSTKKIIVVSFALSVLCLAALGAAAQKSSQSKGSYSILKDRLASIASGKCISRAKVGIKIVSLHTGQTIFEKNASEPLIPASNMKILTAAAALSYLKPEYQFKTVLLHDGNISNGTLKGNLYVKGYGAPDLVAERIWVMLKEFVSLGIENIDGDIVGDDSYFDAMTRPASWPSTIRDNPYGAPISALSCNFNSVRITIVPGPFGGKPFVSLFPFTDFFTIINTAITENTKKDLYMGRVFENGQNRIVISGSISPHSAEISDYRSVDEPTLYTLSCIRETLKEMGIKVRGTIRKGTVPSRAKEALVFRSKPLAQILYDMNKNSNNFMAEMIVKTLGAEMISLPGSTEKGCDAVRLFMKNAGIDVSKIRITDGSGLSRGNLITATSLVSVLQHMDTDFADSYEFAASLPIGGADGTLDKQFRDKRIARKVRAKTGYINGVKSLAGYIENQSGERFAFALLVNASKCGPYDVQEDFERMCEAIVLSSFPH